jgi:hypothetical protein
MSTAIFWTAHQFSGEAAGGKVFSRYSIRALENWHSSARNQSYF